MSLSGNDTNSTYAPQQFNEYIIVFEGNAITCMLIGVYFVIAGMNLHLLRRRKTYKILLLFTIVQLALIVLYTTVVLYMASGRALAAFDIASPESSDVAPNALSTWPAIIANATIVINTCISDAFLLYRCYHVIRLQNRYALAFPVLLYLATVGSSLAWLVVNSIPGAAYSSPVIQLVGICFMSLTTATNICASSFITVRLWMYRRAICNAMGPQHGAFYLSYIAMTLESALLYTIFATITLVVFALNSPLDFAFMSALSLIQAIAPSLIIYRIACGTSFEADDDGSMMIGSIRFASSDQPHTVPSTRSVHQDVSDGPDATLAFSSGNSAEEDQRGLEPSGIHEARHKVHWK